MQNPAYEMFRPYVKLHMAQNPIECEITLANIQWSLTGKIEPLSDINSKAIHKAFKPSSFLLVRVAN